MSTAKRSRSGFSLVELLVVIGIIGFLASLSVVVMLNITASAREDATVATVTKVSRLLDDRMSAFNRTMRGNRLQQAADLLERNAKVAMLPGVYGARAFVNVPVEPRLLDEGAAKAIARKVEFRRNFPQRFTLEEIGPDDENILEGTAGPNGIPDIIEQKFGEGLLSAAREALSVPGGSPPTPAAVAAEAVTRFSAHTEKTESAELLYFALTRLAVFGAAPVDADEFLGGEIADTDGDGLPEFIDAWGEPLRFYRWPTRLIDPDYDATLRDDQNAVTDLEREDAGLLIRSLPPNVSSISAGQIVARDPLKIDPDDPIGRIGFELARLDGANGVDLSLHFNEELFHSPDVFHTPLLVSAGPDGVLGLREPTDVNPGSGIFGNLAQPEPAATAAELADNITNRNRRAGGRQ